MGSRGAANARPAAARTPSTSWSGLVTAIDPALPPGVVVTAVNAAATQAGQRRRLAWALQDRPELLTGAGAQAPVPSVLRLIDGSVRRRGHRHRPAAPARTAAG